MKAVAATTVLLLALAVVVAATTTTVVNADHDGRHHQHQHHGGHNSRRHGDNGGHHHRSSSSQTHLAPAGLTQCVTICGSGVTACMLDCYQPLIDVDPVELPVCLLKCSNDAMVCASGCSVTGGNV